MVTTTIQVPRETRDHLAELAAERGLTLGQLVQQLAAAEPTRAQMEERLKADREIARQNVGTDISDEEFEQAPDILGNIYRMAAEKVRAARGAAA